MSRFRNYWYYSIGLAVARAVALTLVLTIRGPEGGRPFLLTFGGFCIGWVSTTIASFVYPPPKRWSPSEHHTRLSMFRTSAPFVHLSARVPRWECRPASLL
jgi:hypothetical protein